MATPLLGSGGNGGDGNGSADDLENVSLNSFTASPSAIGPFGVSDLAWSVAGVKSPVRVLLDSSNVPAAGHTVVQPVATQGYNLSAISGQARKPLGHVTVTVDRSSCEESSLGNLLVELHEQLLIYVNSQSAYYWPENAATDPNILSVTLSHDTPPLIQVRMVVRVHIAWFPDPWATLQLSFGLSIQNGVFVATVPTSQGSVEFDKVTWFFGGIILGLATALNGANEKATAAGLAAIEGLVGYINTEALQPAAGKTPRVAIVEWRSGQPFFGYVACGTGSEGPLVILANSSSVILSNQL